MSEPAETASFSGTVIDPQDGPPVREMTRLSSFAEVNEVLKSADFLHVVGHRDNAPFLKGSLLSLSGDDHFARRRITAALFSPPALARYERQVFLPALLESFSRWSVGPDGRARGDLTEAVYRALSRLAGVMVGLDGLADEAVLARHMLYTNRMSIGVNIEFVERDHAAVIAECIPYRERFRTEFYEPARTKRAALVAEVARGARPASDLPLDLITIMIQNAEHYAAIGPDAALRDAILFNGASGGVSHAVCNVLNALLPWVEADPEQRRPLLADPAFVRRAALEAIRVRPATPFQIRKSKHDQTLASGRAVAAGEYVLLDFSAATHDRTVYGPTADDFDPFREPLDRVKPSGLAFSNGAHTCIAMALSIGGAMPSAEGPHGLLIALLLELLARDIRLDAGGQAKPKHGTTRAEFDQYPISLTVAPRAAAA